MQYKGEELDAFFAANGGKAGFQNNQVMALETLLFALDEIEAGQVDAARARIRSWCPPRRLGW